MNSSRPDPVHPLHAPPLALAKTFQQAAFWSLAGFGACFLILVLGSWAVGSASDQPAPAASVITRSATLASVLGIVLFIGRLLFLSRSLLARTFAVGAFAATFFGLVMLVVFFVRLALDAKAWFDVMPTRLAERNQALIDKVGSVEQVQKMKAFLAAVEQAGQSSDTDTKKDPGAKLKTLSNLALKALQEKTLPAFADEELRKVEAGLANDLELAPNETEKAQIRQEYEEIRGGKVIDLVPSLRENAAMFDKDYTENTGPGVLLTRFFTTGPSHLPEEAGILPPLLGSAYIALITILAAVPLGVGTAIYLEEYKRTGWFAQVIQTNINNLAGIPSVVYGILGAFLFVELIFKPMESESIKARNLLGGGLTLAFLTLPVVIVSAQEAIRAVPSSIRHAALALGATRWQVIAHHVLPNALPGILTGTILAMSRAIGEAAPLVFFGALLYVDHPPSLFSQFTVLPMQIYGWTNRPDPVWKYNAAMASLVLMLTLLALNAVAIYLRQRAHRKLKW